MTPEHYTLVRLRWPPEADRKPLYRARRCLLDHAPVELHGTGFQLLPNDLLLPLYECLQKEVDPDEVLICMPAPESLEMTDWLYQVTIDGQLTLLIEELRAVSNRIPKGRLGTRLFNKAMKQLDICEQLMDDAPEIVKIRAYCDKLVVFPYHEQPDKGVKLVSAVANKVKLLTGESDE